MSSTSTSTSEVEMLSVSQHGAVTEVMVDLIKEHGEGLQPLKTDVPIEDLMVPSHHKERKVRRRANGDSSTTEESHDRAEEVSKAHRARRRIKKVNKGRQGDVPPPTYPT